MSPRTRMATERSEACSTGCLTIFHTKKQNATMAKICKNSEKSKVISSVYQASTARPCLAFSERDGSVKGSHSPNRAMSV